MFSRLWDSIRGSDNTTQPPSSTFWRHQPVTSNSATYLWERVGDIPRPVPTEVGELYRTPSIPDNTLLEHITSFLQDNYLEGYRVTVDYVMRKLQIPDSISFMILHNKYVIGFIYAQPMTIHVLGRNAIPIYYVDLLCIAKEYRSRGLAKALISHMSNFAPNGVKSFIHKKDKAPLPIPHFLHTQHYTVAVPKLRGDIAKFPEAKEDVAYRIFQQSVSEGQKAWYLEPSADVFRSSVSVKTFLCDRKELPIPLIFSVAFHRVTKFGISVRTAELFYTNWEAVFRLKPEPSALTHQSAMHRIFLELLNTCSLLNATYFVFIGNPFTYYEMRSTLMPSLPLYLHAYNLNIPTIAPDDGDSFSIPAF